MKKSIIELEDYHLHDADLTRVLFDKQVGNLSFHLELPNTNSQNIGYNGILSFFDVISLSISDVTVLKRDEIDAEVMAVKHIRSEDTATHKAVAWLIYIYSFEQNNMHQEVLTLEYLSTGFKWTSE